MFLVFDVTRLSSFSNIKTYIEELREHADPNIVTMFIGNKTDLGQLRVVPTEVAESFASAFPPLLRLVRYEPETAPLRTAFFLLSGKWDDVHGDVRIQRVQRGGRIRESSHGDISHNDEQAHRTAESQFFETTSADDRQAILRYLVRNLKLFISLVRCGRMRLTFPPPLLISGL